MRILVVEDNPGDVRLVREAFREAGPADEILEADRLSAGLGRLAEGGVDAVLLDLGLPDSRGLETLTRMRSEFPRIPVVVMTSIADEEKAVRAVHLGAQDYLVKGQADGRLLQRSLRYAIERERAEEALRKANDELEIRVAARTAELLQAKELLERDIAERKRAEERLLDSERKLRHLSAELLAAQETERKRIAGELHDSVAASLGATIFSVEKILDPSGEGEGAQAELTDLVARLRRINDETRRIMADLRPSVLDDLGIVPALDWFSREYEKVYSHIRVKKRLEVAESRVPDALKTAIYRVCQEAMNNIAKHSGADFIWLDLHERPDRIELAIRDNGRGFDPATSKRGLGLSSMRERAELSGGSFSLEATPGTGTVVRVVWPGPWRGGPGEAGPED